MATPVHQHRIQSVALIGALQEEVELLAQSLQEVSVCEEAGLVKRRGYVCDTHGERIAIVATVAGMGLVNAAATAQHVIDLYHPECIIFSGIAGNMTNSLQVNDIVLGQTLRYLDTDMRLIGQSKPYCNEFHSDERLLQVAEGVLTRLGITHMRGIIASGNYFVDDPHAIARVKAETQADAVEMEGAAIVHVATRNDLPALVVRAMSDNADTAYESFRTFDISEYAHTAARVTLGIVQALNG